MEPSGLVSVAVATYNRPRELRRCLSSVVRQTHQPAEILVIDDHSPESAYRGIENEFRGVKHIRLPRRMGYIFARNLAIETAVGDWILMLDDDAELTAETALEELSSFVEKYPRAGVFALNITGPGGEPAWDVRRDPFSTATHTGCGCLLRKAAVREVGLYGEVFQFMGEEEDLSLRLLDAGWSTVALPAVVVYHAQSPLNRDWRRVRWMGHRNSVLRELLRCPGPVLPYYALGTWLSNTLYNLRVRMLSTELRVLRELPWLLAAAVRWRRPVSWDTYRSWRRLRQNATL
jgi:GT2 family glycosyltransferase